jgi:hypothetical protein
VFLTCILLAIVITHIGFLKDLLRAWKRASIQWWVSLLDELLFWSLVERVSSCWIALFHAGVQVWFLSSVQYPFCQENRTSIIVQILIYECMHSISAWHKSKAAHPVCHSFWKLTPVINIHTFLCKMKQLNLSIDGLICYANEREKSLFVCAKLSDFASCFFFLSFFSCQKYHEKLSIN